MAESMDTDTESSLHTVNSDTRVFWDVVDFPLPLDGDLDHFCLKVERAISNERFVGEVEFYAYGDEISNQERIEIRRAGIWLQQEGAEKRERLNRMLLDVLEYAHHNRDPYGANFLIAMKDIPEKTPGHPIYEPSESDSDEEGNAQGAKKRQNEEGSSQGAEKLQKITDEAGAQ
ncbi:unnamed protein product [Microthlaspi erraticum]|uniref:NYN domain-containing protein n=1 Tax=Microthlaspi erraticum TaxID=1685480 RepID=A0A6D2IYV2_9BRAS|nr:unnamed protein product [Microthlaspi erraticum]